MAQPTSFVRARVRGAVDRVLIRVRGALDLPSRAELVDLTERLELLDRRISELAADRVAELTRAIPALPEPAAPPEVVEAAEPEVEAAAPSAEGADATTSAEPTRKNGRRRDTPRARKR